jgi:hypothetical protein
MIISCPKSTEQKNGSTAIDLKKYIIIIYLIIMIGLILESILLIVNAVAILN